MDDITLTLTPKNDEIILRISEWWLASNELPGLILPDGWAGRPWDNVHSLSAAIALRHRLLLEINHLSLLVFVGPVEVIARPKSLLFQRYSRCIMSTLEWGTLKPSTARVYRDGVVEFRRRFIP
jgi:hypothetical protein